MQNDNLENITPTDAKNVLAEVFNTWTNQFGDRIASHGMGLRSTEIKEYDTNITINYDGKYLKTVGGLKVAKGIVNKLRGIKCKWVGSAE